jgi:alpha,alpha-trehalose phosphorylase
MQLPFDEHLPGVLSQDNDFMTLEPWDWNTPRSKYPLLLNFHPLVIYRHQVLKQADTVLAMFLQWQDFTAEEKRRAFDFYDPITTGDSTLSACVQGIMAAEVGYGKAALEHFTECRVHRPGQLPRQHHRRRPHRLHRRSVELLVCGFAGPARPGSFRLKVQGRLLAVDLAQGSIALTLRGADYSEEPLLIDVRGHGVTVGVDSFG